MNTETHSEDRRILRRIFKIAIPHLSVRGDIDHVRISARFARLLLKAEGGDEKIVLPAILLHDVGWSAVPAESLVLAYGVRAKGNRFLKLNRTHEIQGAAIAKKILFDIGYPGSLISIIAAIIKRHDSGKKADSIEEKIVKDADKLWRFSKVGFWEEAKRQGISPMELHEYLSKKYHGWFFTQKALEIAGNRLKHRGREMRSASQNIRSGYPASNL
ncbi:MAG: HD domain-containing protein [Thermodesulfobacteriota bacterium]